ncbi:MAG: hypothetical protein ABR555_04820 [Pyrinomonadaceae bacterium]
MHYGFPDLIGNIGVLLLVVAYLLLQLNRLSSASLTYSLLNIAGAGLIILSLLSDFNFSALLMEVFWVLVSFIGIYRYFRMKALRSDS